MTSRDLVWCGCLAACLALPARGDEAAPARPSVAELIQDLAADDYKAREAADRQLRQAGPEAVGPLVEAGQAGDLEVLTRVIRILRTLYYSADGATAEAAEAALEQLALTDNYALATRAESVFWENPKRRQERALARVKELGGIVQPLAAPDVVNRGAIPFNVNNGLPPGELPIAHVLLGAEWKGGDAGLVHVKRLMTLRTLYYTPDAKVSAEAFSELQKSMPELEVQPRGQACLGVKCSRGFAACLVQGVEPGSAAAKGGLRTGDVITGFGSEDVTDFEQLVGMIKQKKVGEKVPIRLSRNGENITLDVTLGAWQATPPAPRDE